ncbi:MAG: hypothetical protein SVK08_09980 [Halobacteriota archaeon]|nr:hypothetical protein [Halobacteriota archaeon]
MAGILTEDDLKRVEAIKKLKAEQLAEIEDKWTKEIDRLERRVTDQYEDVDLGNGDTLAIRTRLSALESNQLDQKLKKLKTAGDNDNADESNSIMCEIISVVTANPLLTKDYLMNNMDKYATMDVINAVESFYTIIAKKGVELKEIQSFRTEQSGD